MIQLVCPHCGSDLNIEERYAGSTGKCKKCSGSISVPKLLSTPVLVAKPLVPPVSDVGRIQTDAPLVVNPIHYGEEALWEGHPSILNYTIWIVLGLLLIRVYFFGAAILVVAIIHRHLVLYKITARSVTSATGILSRKEKQVALRDIRAVSVDRSLLQMLFGLATVSIATAGTGGVEIQFRGIRDWKESRSILEDTDLRGR